MDKLPKSSTAVTAAVKLARAYTGKDIVLRCAEQPSFDDWFMVQQIYQRHYKDTIKLTKNFITTIYKFKKTN